MRIGILTFHRAHNYGAMLQTYGLLNFLKSMGHDVYVIDYCPVLFKKAYRRTIPAIPRNPLNILKVLVNEPFVHKCRVKRYDAFNEFMKSEFNLYPWKKGFDGREFDIIFIGSDQVWNKDCLGGFDKIYWGDGLKCKVASYAASLAWFRPSAQELTKVKNYLNNFHSISVRENDAAEYLASITNKPIDVVCDPTLLLDAQDWERVSIPVDEDKKYVLCYDLVSNPQCQEFAGELARSKGLKLINIVGVVNKTSPVNSVKTAGPREFLSYFRNSEYVVTTSFHGTAFSLIFNKQFYALGISKFGGRIQSLLRTMGLEKRMQIPDDLHNLEMCDFADVNKKLQQLVLSSKQYISRTISE